MQEKVIFLVHNIKRSFNRTKSEPDYVQIMLCSKNYSNITLFEHNQGSDLV